MAQYPSDSLPYVAAALCRCSFFRNFPLIDQHIMMAQRRHNAANTLAFTHNKIVAKMPPCRKYARAIKSLGYRGKNGKKEQGRKT
jgi:hypothetical protein